MQVLNIFHVLIAIAMIAFILIQKGAGATAGAAFGSGASGTVFGSRGAGNFLSRSTWVMAALFCLISLTMAVMASRMSLAPETDLGVVATAPVAEQAAEPTVSDLPAADTPLSVESAEPSDVPSIDSVIAQPAIDETAGDLPPMDSESDTAEETAVTDDGS
jgi:preprotein translocase subunit SecG